MSVTHVELQEILLKNTQTLQTTMRGEMERLEASFEPKLEDKLLAPMSEHMRDFCRRLEQLEEK
eukprot:12926133-Prorocentrum_lima.AAC.1